MNVSRILRKVKGFQFYELFKQFDWIIINFGDPVKYSLHIASAVRVCHQDKIILNNSDVYFAKDCIEKSDEGLVHSNEPDSMNDIDSLFEVNVKKVNCLLKGKFVKKIKVSKWKDLIIRFFNQTEIQIIQDCLGRDYEYYRLIEFSPHLDDDPSQYSSKHYIVYNDKGKARVKME